MVPAREAVVIVDPFSSGAPFTEEVRDTGCFVIGILSSQIMDECWLKQFRPELYDASYEHCNIEDTVAFLRNLPGLHISAIMPGSEPGVELAETLREYFPDVERNLGSSSMRRHKASMHAQLRKKGVRAMNEICTGDVEEAIEWIAASSSYPIIVKPPQSGGSDGLFFCHSDADIRNAFEKELNEKNFVGIVNTKLLVQQFLDGPEYVVDAVSYEGKHLVLGMWKYSKAKNTETKAITYEYSDFLPYSGEAQDKIIPYVKEALDALGINFGASHSEVIIDKDGPCLVETGARLHGGLGPRCIQLATGVDPSTVLTDICLFGGRLFKGLYKQNGYNIKEHVVFTDLANFKVEGILDKCIEERLKEEMSTIRLIKTLQVGDHLKITRDMITSPGYFAQSHINKEVIWEEMRRLRKMEADDLYIVRDPVEEHTINSDKITVVELEETLDAAAA